MAGVLLWKKQAFFPR